MLFSYREVALRHLCIIAYLFVILILVFLIIREKKEDAPAFSLSDVATTSGRDPAVVSISGKGFHPGIQIVSARSFVNENAFLWKSLSNVRTRSLDVENNLALVTCSDNKLVSLRLDGNKPPTFLGSIDLPSPVKKILIVGDQALVATQRHAGIYLVSLKDPEALEIIANYQMSGLVADLVADRKMVYFADTFRGLGRIDLAADNPVPEIVEPMDSPWKIDLQGDKLVVATVKGKVRLFNISQAGELLEAGRFDSHLNVRGVAFVNDSLVITLADNSLRVYGLSLWPRLENPSTLALPGHPLLLESVPGQASVVVSLVSGGMVLVDIADPEIPVVIGRLLMPKTFLGMALYSENLLTVGRDGLEMFSLDKISGGGQVLLANEVLIDLEDYKLQAWHQQIYGLGNNRLVRFDGKLLSPIHSPEHFLAIVEEDVVNILEPDRDGTLRRVGSLDLPGVARDVLATDNVLYVLHQAGLSIFTGSRADELVVAGGLSFSGEPKQLEMLDSGPLLVLTRDNGVLVMDPTDPLKPRLVTSIVQPEHLRSINVAHDVLADGRRVYVAQGEGGIHVFDMSSPSQPKLTQVIPIAGSARRMALLDDLLLVADASKGLFMIDVSDNTKALPVGSLATPLRIDQLAVLDNGLLVSSHPGGTMRLPLPERIKGIKTTRGEMTLELEKVEEGQYLYLYDDKGSQQVQVRM